MAFSSASGGGIGIQEEGAGIGAVFFFVGLDGCNGHGIGGGVHGTGGVDALGVFAGDLDKGVVLDAVIGDENGIHALFAHLGDDLGGLGMITAENHRLGAGLV